MKPNTEVRHGGPDEQQNNPAGNPPLPAPKCSTPMTLEQYLKANFKNGVIHHAIRASIGDDDKPRFYIHPAGVSGETMDFVVTKNELHPVYVWDGMQQLAAANPIPPDIRAKMDADRDYAETAELRYREALEQIATGHISGEQNNYESTVFVMRQIAAAAIGSNTERRHRDNPGETNED